MLVNNHWKKQMPVKQGQKINAKETTEEKTNAC